jgi:hypothetical protein
VEEVSSNEHARRRPTIFNSALETGIRQLIILDALHPRACDLKELTWFDHLIVHSADVGGPESLHPAIEGRVGELTVRREIILQSLKLMQQTHLVEEIHTDGGVQYQASDDAPIFLDALSSEYSRLLKERALWLNERFGSMPTEEIGRHIQERIGYRVQFLPDELPGHRDDA